MLLNGHSDVAFIVIKLFTICILVKDFLYLILNWKNPDDRAILFHPIRCWIYILNSHLCNLHVPSICLLQNIHANRRKAFKSGSMSYIFGVKAFIPSSSAEFFIGAIIWELSAKSIFGRAQTWRHHGSHLLNSILLIYFAE